MSGSNDYYVPHSSQWPIVATIGLFFLAFGTATFLNDLAIGKWLMLIGAGVLIYMLFGWFGIVIRESEGGYYSSQVDTSFRMGMGWFIFSEVLFFAAFFGALFYVRKLAIPWLDEAEILWPGYDGGWPTAGPAGPQVLGPDTHVDSPDFFSTIGAWGLPMWNTIILLTSSVTCTFAHWAFVKGQRGRIIFWLAITVALGCLFLYFQAEEYHEAYTAYGLTLGTGIYGSTFFMLTGFHGLHVTIGTLILFIVLLRVLRGHFTEQNHFAFEGAAWYWHFVDTVWLLLFVFVYVL